MDFFSPFLFAGMPVVGIAVVVFFIIAIVQEGKRVQGAIRWAYFYAVSLIGLAIVVGSVTFLLNQLAAATIFPKADDFSFTRGVPPPLFFESATASGETAKPVAVEVSQQLSCTGACTLTDAQRRSVDSWKASYQSWKDQSPLARRGQNVVNALSFLLVAAPLYLLHFLWIQRKRRAEGQLPTTLNATYLYTVSIVGLLIVVISGALLLNLGLKSAFLSDDAQKPQNRYPVMANDTAAIQSLIDCQGKCAGLTDEDVRLAAEWKGENDAFQTAQNDLGSQRQRDLANNLPLLLVGIPLFWFHFAAARRDSGKQDQPTTTTSV